MSAGDLQELQGAPRISKEFPGYLQRLQGAPKRSRLLAGSPGSSRTPGSPESPKNSKEGPYFSKCRNFQAL
ncbi:MAG: hypothetical protein LBT62_07320 [Deltaproteobacteria bacterium]|nr:hypothetical protein [Deltaproteobacteria bacterium]